MNHSPPRDASTPSAFWAAARELAGSLRVAVVVLGSVNRGTGGALAEQGRHVAAP